MNAMSEIYVCHDMQCSRKNDQIDKVKFNLTTQILVVYLPFKVKYGQVLHGQIIWVSH
jgi:hypothetical protein